ncbi:hypothetical protein BOTBODRAFT_142447 [Botryobasidium botryosum FD-172 SS1]|uniref:F-box domain-containing protein n=1 Tax=Botryobasidium botryosum (strain FD-172 SS1) TaxID=930990 RepID=A0A067NBG3_BOTB1|nr:hypothetical protein BOTBODRAFT_142447 [Botryobasidium botryosum FD-172 SS1]
MATIKRKRKTQMAAKPKDPTTVIAEREMVTCDVAMTSHAGHLSIEALAGVIDAKRYNIASGYLKNPATFFQPLRPHARRWRSVRILRAEVGDLHEILHSPAPNLRTLCVRGSDSWPGELDWHASDLFGGDPPGLHELELVRVPLPLSSPMFAGLTRLHLQHITFTRSTIQQLLYNMSKCPSLEEFTLACIHFAALAQADLDLMATIGVVRLSRLRVIGLYTMERAVIRAILSALSAPSIQSICATSKGPMTLRSALPPKSHLPEIFPFLPRIPRLYVRHYIIIQGIHEWYLRGGTSQRSRPDSPEMLYITGQAATHQDIQNMISGIGHDLPFINLKTLYIADIHANTMAAYTAMLGNLPTITLLELKNCSVDAVQALMVTDTSHLCPLLRELILIRVPVDDACLIAFAESRARGGNHPVHLHKIEVKSSRKMTASAVEELAGLSIAVEWDGI